MYVIIDLPLYVYIDIGEARMGVMLSVDAHYLWRKMI